VASELRRLNPDAGILFVGSGRDLENRLIPGAGFDLVNIKMSGFARGVTPDKFYRNIKTAKNLMTAGREAEKLICGFRPDAAIGTGGYICYPILKKASEAGIPTFIHESNAIPGLTTKLLSAVVDKVLVSFPGLERLYRRPERVLLTGTPVRGEFEDALKDGNSPQLDGKPLIVSFWGSLGAELMNEVMADFIKLNVDSGHFRHIHATGKSGGAESMRNKLKRLGAAGDLPAGIDIREYIYDMPLAMAAADVVLCRAGASTIAELALMGKPAVLVPSPFVANNHQVENAKQIQKAGGAIMLMEKKCTGASLYETVFSLLKDRDKLKRMSEAQKSIATPGAAERIAKLVVAGAGKMTL
jgi:UDP-N-acetylglucosamine--N-acetylmuramyl-(pentapeptide) pyrophosphoryl-undecaprenol N-acetylglucosamine transferase